MKKTILIILAVLPIVLLLVIAFAGQILSFYQHISVERVEFVDRAGNAYGDVTFELDKNETRSVRVKIYPANASDQSLTFVSQNPEICAVDAEGNLTGVDWGDTTVVVKSLDGSRTAILHVRVHSKIPEAVYLSHEEISLKKREKFQLTADVDAPVSEDQRVTYASSDERVATVNPLGQVTARGVGTATITVTTVSGAKQDTCTVTVTDGDLPLDFDFATLDGILIEDDSDTYVTTLEEISLREHIKLSDELQSAGVTADDVSLYIQAGGKYADLDAESGVITFKGEGIVTVHAYIGDVNSPDYFMPLELLFRYR